MKSAFKPIDTFCLIASGILIVWAVARCGGTVVSVLIPFVTACILSSFLYAPSVYLAESFSISLKITCVFTVTSFSAALISFIYIAAARLFREAADFSAALGGRLQTILNRFDSLSDAAEQALSLVPFSEKLLAYAEKVLPSVSEKITGALSSLAAQMLPSLFLSLPHILIVPGTAFLATCFLISEKEAIDRFLGKKLNERHRAFLSSIGHAVSEAAGQYGKAYGTIGIITFCELFSGFLLMRREYALLSALLITLIDILPVFGCGTVLVPWSIVEWVSGRHDAALELLLLYAVISLVRQWAEPRIVGSSVGLSPLAALFFLYAGGKLFGVLGLFLLPFSAVIVKNLYEKGLLRVGHQEKTADESETVRLAREKYRRYKKEK